MLQSSLQKHYTLIFLVFLVLVITFSYLIGLEQGQRKGGGGDAVVLRCTDAPASVGALTGVETTVQSTAPSTGVPESVPQKEGGLFVGSKNGTKYYTPGCSGAQRIKPENYIWFQSVEDATLQGYSRGSC